MGVSSAMTGVRLEYVVRPLKGKVKRKVSTLEATKKEGVDGKVKVTHKIVQKDVEVDAGFMVYLPSGHSYRLTAEELHARGLHKQPKILNFDKVSDTESPAGRFKHALSDAARKDAWRALEEEVIRCCKRSGGHDLKENTDAAAAA